MNIATIQRRILCASTELWKSLLICIGLSIIGVVIFEMQWLNVATLLRNNVILNFRTGFNIDHSENCKKLDRSCKWYFLNYTPSSWEKRWFLNIERFQTNVCERLANTENVNKTALAVERLVELQKFGRSFTGVIKQEADNLLSKMFYRLKCVDAKKTRWLDEIEVSQTIEPLIGLLRDPLTMCPRILSLPASLYDGADIQSKRFFLLSIAAPFHMHYPAVNLSNTLLTNFQQNTRNSNIPPWMYDRLNLNLKDAESYTNTQSRQNILIDLGSSYFGSWNGDTSAAAGRWFYEHYKRFGVAFDRVIAYEHSALNTKTAWEMLPADVFPSYTLINVGVSSNGTFNPWIMLKAIAKPHDHVIIKLDIDSPSIESPLIHQILNDSSIHSLIDELFFEHHITVKEMQPFWGSPQGNLRDSYIMFTKLRQIGIRAHSWP